MTAQPRRFALQRDVDVTGVSGTGVVALGVRWPDGTASVRWLGDRPSTVHWDRFEDAVAVHGHGGATRIVWTDEELADGAEPRLRDRIAQALAADDGHPWDTLSIKPQQHYLDNADAVLAVLPRGVDRVAVLREAAAAAYQLPTPDCAEMGSLTSAWNRGAHAVAAELRRMADDAEGSAS
jgi:hypothetical protein